MKPAFLLRVYILRRARAADSFVLEAGMRFFRTLWKKSENIETLVGSQETIGAHTNLSYA